MVRSFTLAVDEVRPSHDLNDVKSSARLVEFEFDGIRVSKLSIDGVESAADSGNKHIPQQKTPAVGQGFVVRLGLFV